MVRIVENLIATPRNGDKCHCVHIQGVRCWRMGVAGWLALAEGARVGASFGEVVCEQGVAQGDAVALRAGVKALFVYGAAPRFRVQKLARRGVVYDHVAVFVYFAHEAASSALVAEFVPRCTVFQVAGYDGPRWKHAFSFWVLAEVPGSGARAIGLRFSWRAFSGTPYE